MKELLTITITPELKKDFRELIISQDKKISTVVNSMIKKYLEQNQENGNTNN